VLLAGYSITGLPSHKLARLGIGYVPEDRRIFRLLTVMENLRTGLDRHGMTDARKHELLDKVFTYFPVLAERRKQAGGTLSGGEQQMLAIARAMMLEPRIILLDEPTEGLMPRMVSQIRQIIDVLHREGVAILLVEQNVPLTLEASERIYIMEKGVVRHHCAASEIRVNDAVIHQYLGLCGMDATLEFLSAIPYDQILVQTVNGIVTGMILALVASGLTLIFGIMDVVNFAHGELFMLGAYIGCKIV
jgi:branched-chain amino acid transport system ATP-binding protein